MDEDILALCIFMALLLAFPFSIVFFTTACIAYARTKKWDKERATKAAHIESETNTLLDGEEDDFLDTEDEADYHERKAEEERDRLLTFNQKWRKEFGKVWNGKGAKQLIKEREREERRKLAKAIAREMDRRERHQARRAAAESLTGAGEALPPYKN